MTLQQQLREMQEKIQVLEVPAAVGDAVVQGYSRSLVGKKKSLALDCRPTSLHVAHPTLSVSEAESHFSKYVIVFNPFLIVRRFGSVVSVQPCESGIIVEFQARWQAEKAFLHGNILENENLTLSWHVQAKLPTNE